MCSDPTKAKADELLGANECVSPFGVYDLEIPVDKDLVCGSPGLTSKNCKDLDVSSTFSFFETYGILSREHWSILATRRLGHLSLSFKFFIIKEETAETWLQTDHFLIFAVLMPEC